VSNLVPFGGGYLVGTRRMVLPGSTTISTISFVVGDHVAWSHDMPAAPAGWSSGAAVAAGCDRAIACWRNPIDVGAADPRATDQCAIYDATGAQLVAPFDIDGGTRWSNLAYPENIDVEWMNGQFIVFEQATRSAPGASYRPGVDTNEVFAAVAPDGTIAWRRALDLQYPYGDVVNNGDCAVAVVVGGSLMRDLPNAMAAPFLETMCTHTCP
jgi:hypothetical protein